MSVLLSKSTQADITLLLEGTYPFIQGGVSSWVHQMISKMSEYTFSLIFIGGSPDNYGDMLYELPENVVHLEVHYLMDAHRTGLTAAKTEGNADAFVSLGCMHDALRSGMIPSAADLADVFAGLGSTGHGISHADFLYSKQAWHYIRKNYMEHCTDPSFVDYFWTIRTMHAPIFILDKIARGAPDSTFYHTISTGYAGFLGAMLASRRNKKLLISEHGIYTKERKVDLAQAEWITENLDTFAGGINSEMSYLRRLWTHFFEGIGRISYQSSARIVALFEGNRLRQVQDGAAAEKTCVIPNGIQIDRFLPCRENRGSDIPMVAALVGRVVPIKDIKTFIRAMHLVCNHIPEAEGWIVGPDNEDPEYAQECRVMAENMGLGDRIRFLGRQNVVEIFPQIGVNVLTSISEGLPLVMLEGYASGVPAVTTDVGACHELVYGVGDADKALGAAGEVVSIANPEATGQAIVSLLSDTDVWQAAQLAGIRRVETYYNEGVQMKAYRELYLEMMAD